MKKILGTALFLSTTSLYAAGYGVVDVEKVAQSSDYLKQQNSAIQQSVQAQTTQIDQLTQQLTKLQKTLQESKTEAERKKLVPEYQTKVQQLDALQQQVQAKVQGTWQNVNKTFDGRLKLVAEQLRQENKLDVLLNKHAALAYDAKYDLTDKMIQKVNAIK